METKNPGQANLITATAQKPNFLALLSLAKHLPPYIVKKRMKSMWLRRQLTIKMILTWSLQKCQLDLVFKATTLAACVQPCVSNDQSGTHHTGVGVSCQYSHSYKLPTADVNQHLQGSGFTDRHQVDGTLTHTNTVVSVTTGAIQTSFSSSKITVLVSQVVTTNNLLILQAQISFTFRRGNLALCALVNGTLYEF